MTSESSVTKINAVIGIIAGAIALLTWLTGLSSAPEMVFGKEAKKPLSLQPVFTDENGQEYSVAALWKKINTENRIPATTKKDTASSILDSISTTEGCNLLNRRYTGAYSSIEYVYFEKFENARYMVKGQISSPKLKGVITSTGNTTYKVISGNFLGTFSFSADCSTLFGNIVDEDGNTRRFTYYVEK
jgi:hypothetical protein